ncbi:MAG TPA: cyclomaltodextrinase N-terminal domain-containing protein, partial [Pyrinomonadaceae bacterium]|nr:cyclomaltodextrinase N-terminal domain-containing protein [Pyrinomonadaceae bacterium]
MASAQSPEILKVDPPSWWTRSSMNPVRVMIRGRNFQGARVQISGSGLRTIGAPKINDRGTYIFVDVSIAGNAPSGER